MRASYSLSVALTALASLANANIAYVLTFDPQSQAKHQISLGSLSPDTARLVLAQRAGVEDYHLTTRPSGGEINVFNKYGAKSSIFEESPEKAFLLAELPEEHESHTQLRMHARFTIANPPDFATTQELFQDFATQARPSSTAFYVASDANELIKQARDLASKKISVTALLVPAGSSMSSWGTYTMPREKRQAHRVEEPIAVHVTANTSNYTNDKPLRGIFPLCFSSRRVCESTTRGCTGHGACQLKWTNKDSKGGECWGCQCNATVTNGLTTNWAGPACQKKDISVEFWLIALFSIGLVALVTFAIGNLVSMGEQELPGVLGAGVSGPTARK